MARCGVGTPSERRKAMNVYDVDCPSCGSSAGDSCFMRRPPWDVCMWPHRERLHAASETPELGGRLCPDGGSCHHNCPNESCFRVRYCVPLSHTGAEDWPSDITDRFGGTDAGSGDPITATVASR